MSDATKTAHARDSIKHAVALLDEIDRNSLYEYHGDLWPEYWEALEMSKRALVRTIKLATALSAAEETA